MVMSLIESLTRIKNAVYGREVREGIHDGVFRANQIADGADAKADSTQIRQDAVEDFNNQVIQEMTDKDVISAPEIIQARGGKPTLGERLDETTAQLAKMTATVIDDNPISPENFSGNSFEKISQAIVMAIAENRSVKFAKMYDITGLGTIVIDKPATNRRMLYLQGDGGGIIKKDAGYIFTAKLPGQGDIVSNNMKYESIQGCGMTVWNGNTIIRLNSVSDSYISCDGIIKADERYLQSIRISRCTILEGLGYAVSARHMFDCTFDENTVEIRDSFIQNSYDIPAKFVRDNMNLRIINNVIEGLSGKAIFLGACHATKISGNYFEYNEGGYIDLSANPHTVSHIGLEVSSNFFEQTDSQSNSGVPAINWGFFPYDVSSTSNVSKGLLHFVSIASTGTIISTGDASIEKEVINNTGRIMLINQKLLDYVKDTNADGEIRTAGSLVIQQSTGVSVPSLGPGAETIVNIPMPRQIISPATVDFLIAEPQYGPNLFQIVNYAYGSGFTSINVKIKNLHTSASTCKIYAIAQHFRN